MPAARRPTPQPGRSRPSPAQSRAAKEAHRQRLWENGVTRLERAVRELAPDQSLEARSIAARLDVVIARLRENGPPMMPPDPTELAGRDGEPGRPRRLFAPKEVASRQYRRGAIELRDAFRAATSPLERTLLSWAVQQVTSLPDGNPFVRPGPPPPERFRQKQTARQRTHRL